jgi:hypothetical protein
MLQTVTREFLATKARLEELIYINQSAAKDGEEDYPILARMTNVTDSVD